MHSFQEVPQPSVADGYEELRLHRHEDSIHISGASSILGKSGSQKVLMTHLNQRFKARNTNVIIGGTMRSQKFIVDADEYD
jgi:hypothetical protein